MMNSESRTVPIEAIVAALKANAPATMLNLSSMA